MAGIFLEIGRYVHVVGEIHAESVSTAVDDDSWSGRYLIEKAWATLPTPPAFSSDRFSDALTVRAS